MGESKGELHTSDASSAKPGMVSSVRTAKNRDPQKNVTRRALVSFMDALKGGPCTKVTYFQLVTESLQCWQ
jgi:hypothetical protein